MSTLTFKRAAVFGATGATGREIVRELRRRGMAVRAVSRSNEKLVGDFGDLDVGSAAFAREDDYLHNRADLNTLLDSLWFDSDGDRTIDATDAGLLPRVVVLGDTTQLLLTDDSVTLAEGVLWNAQLAFTADRTYFGDGEVFGQRFWAGKSSGNGVHNPFLLETLMTVSITALRTYLDEGQN